MIILCTGAGLYFSVAMKFPQIRYLKTMMKLTVVSQGSSSGISPFQAFATTVGARVGIGNIAGVATAVHFGGPGAIFWMWLITFLGAGSAFVETVLGQAYKTKRYDGEYVGGPAFYIEKGLKLKFLAWAFVAATLIGPGIFMPGVQIHSIAAAVEEAFNINEFVTALVVCVAIGLIICGGIKRIGRTAELLIPFMCLLYLLLTLGVCILRFEDIPKVFILIFSSAFGQDEAFGGIIGATIAWGIKRGVYSNEAGMGSGALLAAPAECRHPTTQGLVQILSVYADTLIICTASALIILLSGSFNIVGRDGQPLVENLPGVHYGILYVQHGLNTVLPGRWAGGLLAGSVALFAFTTIMGYYYQAESNISYLFKDKPYMIWIFRIVFLLANFLGVLIEGGIVWDMADIGVGSMAWINLIAIIFLGRQSFIILKDYERQIKAGQELSFDPSIINVKDEAGVWSKKGA
jgi:AGCS family alanine or glycine:cation symporter